MISDMAKTGCLLQSSRLLTISNSGRLALMWINTSVRIGSSGKYRKGRWKNAGGNGSSLIGGYCRLSGNAQWNQPRITDNIGRALTRT